MNGFRDAGRNDTYRGPTYRGPGARARDLAVSSRSLAIAQLHAVLEQGEPSLVLLTGESGSGKSWVWRGLVEELPKNWRWVSVDMAGELDATGFLYLVCEGLEIEPRGRLAEARIAVARELQDDARSGRHCLLVIENAQNAPPPVLDELLALAHAMESVQGSGFGYGFGAMILVGPTELSRKLMDRRHGGLATRIQKHVHLLPLDLDESVALMRGLGGQIPVDRETLDGLHRDARGNPRVLLNLARQALRERAPTALPGAAAAAPAPPAEAAPGLDRPRKPHTLPLADDSRTAPQGPTSTPAPASTLSLVPSRPPLRVEDGLIEVGWEGNLEAEDEAFPEPPEAGGNRAHRPLPWSLRPARVARSNPSTSTPRIRRASSPARR